MKIKDVFSKKIMEILSSKIKLISLCTIFFVFIGIIFYSFKFTYAIPEDNNNYDLFFPNISKHNEPTDLLVMVFLYDDYDNPTEGIDYVFNMTDEEIKTKYYNEIFGSGTIEDQTWSVNDYYKENSNGKFYFNPVLIGDNESGIYPVRFHKTYNMDNFSSDIKEGFKTLIDKGFMPEGFGTGYNGTDKKKILCIFPKIKIEHFGSYFITDNFLADMAVTSFTSILSVTTHELGHALGLPDLYYQGQHATLMGEISSKSDIPDNRYPGNPRKYHIIPHMDPLHKIALGWQDYEIIDSNTTVKLYPTTSSLYNPIIIPTDDNNQYYIIENRQATSFESEINKYYYLGDESNPEDEYFGSYEGVNIWRIDKLGYSVIQSSIPRKGDFVIRNLQYENESFFPKKYISSEDKSSSLMENTNIKITYIKKNVDGSIDINIDFDEKYKNSYTVRYNSNDGTDNYIDNKYSYTQKVEFLSDLFSKEDYKLIEWNTMQDGSGTGYNPNYFNEVYGLTEENNGIVNLYAQWKKLKNVISFNANGGIGTMDEIELTDNMINDGYILPEAQFTSPSTNLIFKGWYVPEYESVKQPGETVYLSGDNELVAQWGSDISINNCTINFNSNGGTNIDNQQITKGGLVIEPKNPVKDGYVFGGWYEDDTYNTKFYFSKTIYSDLTLYAKWIPNENIIKSIDLKMEIPTVGDKVTIEKEKYEDMEYWNWDSQKPQMKITISDEDHYHLSDESGSFNYMHWITKDSYDTILDPYDVEPFIGSFEYDTTYYARLFLETDDEYLFADDLTVTVNGSNKTKIIYVYEDFLGVALEITTPKEKEESGKYTILEGANQKYLLDAEKDLIIKVDGEISNFEDIKVDDIIVDKVNYSITSGSTVVALKKAYLNTLLEGTHKITFIYKDGEVSTTFTMDDYKTDNKDDDIIEEIVTTTKPIENIEDKNNNLPTTGDGIIIWGLIYIIGLIGSIITYKKIRSKYEIN